MTRQNRITATISRDQEHLAARGAPVQIHTEMHERGIETVHECGNFTWGAKSMGELMSKFNATNHSIDLSTEGWAAATADIQARAGRAV